MSEKKTLVDQTNELEMLFSKIASLEEEGKDVPNALMDQVTNSLSAHAEKIDRCAAFVKRTESQIEWLKNEKDALNRIQKQLNWRISRMKQLAGGVMDAQGSRKIDGMRGHYFSKRSTVKLSVVDENQIPDEYIIWTKTLDKSKIKQDIKDGKHVPGAELVKDDAIIVR